MVDVSLVPEAACVGGAWILIANRNDITYS